MSTNGQSQSEWICEALERFEGPLIRYAQRFTGDLERARDVVQDTFMKLCRQDPGELDGHLSQWLFTVCRNAALDVQKKERRMTTTTELVDRASPPAAPPDHEATVHDSAAQALRLLDQLPPNQQEVIRLKFQNELSYREIADVTGLTTSNVGFLLHVGLKRLRELLKAEFA
jgi:RNA polymerase sigma factor (sigma-70 family)